MVMRNHCCVWQETTFVLALTSTSRSLPEWAIPVRALPWEAGTSRTRVPKGHAGRVPVL